MSRYLFNNSISNKFIKDDVVFYGSQIGYYNFFYPKYEDDFKSDGHYKINELAWIGPDDMIAFTFFDKSKYPLRRVYWAYKKDVERKVINSIEEHRVKADDR